MDLSHTAEERAFRREVRAWLTSHVPRRRRDERPREWLGLERVAQAKAWQRQVYEAGYLALAWPREWGGQGADLMRQTIVNEEMVRARAPALIGLMGIQMVGPTLIQHGNEEQRRRFLPKILGAEEIWCQGYSEPGAGSDLAALHTRAVEDGDDFIVNGQKVWTSFAQRSDYCILIVRTDPSVPKHKGLSYLLMDMRSPGITIRPLVQITGDAEFNEVFFEDVRVPKANLLGAKNQGWQVIVTTLMFERVNFGGGDPMYQIEPWLARLTALAKRIQINGRAAAEDSAVRQQLAQFHTEMQAITYNGFRQLTQQMRGSQPGPEGSINKLAIASLNLRMAHFATELLGPYGQMELGEPHSLDGGEWSQRALGARVFTIAGGTVEIQRNILGERVLGLPKE